MKVPYPFKSRNCFSFFFIILDTHRDAARQGAYKQLRSSWACKSFNIIQSRKYSLEEIKLLKLSRQQWAGQTKTSLITICSYYSECSRPRQWLGNGFRQITRISFFSLLSWSRSFHSAATFSISSNCHIQFWITVTSVKFYSNKCPQEDRSTDEIISPLSSHRIPRKAYHIDGTMKFAKGLPYTYMCNIRTVDGSF